MSGQEKIMPYDRPKAYYPFLDGFRAFAVLWVLFHHAIYCFDLQPLLGIVYRPVMRFGYLGFLGVDVFFVISGFLITGLLVDDLNTHVRMKRFYVRRFFKIVPHYVLMVAVGLAVWRITAPSEGPRGFTVWPYLIFLQNYLHGLPTLSHLWSIAIEEHFYLFYPLLLSLLVRLHPQPEGRRKWLTGLFLVLIIAANYVRYLSWSGLTNPHDPWPTQMSHVRFDGLIFGCLIKMGEPWLTSLRPRVRVWGSLTALGGAMMMYGFFFLHFNKIGWFYYTAAYLAAGLLIICALLGGRPVIHLTEIPCLRWIGRNSYGIYLWHYPLLMLMAWGLALREGVSAGVTAAGVVMYFSLAISLGALTTVTVERYFLELRKTLMP